MGGIAAAAAIPGASVAAATDAAASPPPPTPAHAGPSTGADAVQAVAQTTVQAISAADGDIELVRGSSRLARVSLMTPLARRGAAEARELEIDHHRIVELRVPVRGRAAEEVWVGDVGVRPPRAIWFGIAGPRDADEEAAIDVDVTANRIVEYQTAAEVTRCDGVPVRLFPRAWDFASARFRPILSTTPPAAAQTLTARRDDPAMPSGRPMGGFRFTAASTTSVSGADARALTAPGALDDGDPKTVWSEGLGGDGRGEFLTARASAGRARVRGLRIVPGDASTPAAFKARNRIKMLHVAFGPEPERQFEIAFPEDPAAVDGKARVPYWVALPVPIESACMTATIRDVYRGGDSPAAGGGTTAISDLDVFTDLDEANGVERLVAEVAAGDDCPSRVPLLVALGEAVVLPAAQSVLGASGVGRECLVEALARVGATVKSRVALDALVAALTGATANEELLITRTLRAAPTPPVSAVSELLAAPHATDDDRARAAGVLGALGGAEATRALLAAAGGGSPDVRTAVVQALARAPEATVAVLVAAMADARAAVGAHGTAGAAARSGAREADLLRVLPAAAARVPADRAVAVEAVRRAFAGGPTFEIRARALVTMGALGEPRLAGDLGNVRAHDGDAVLRLLATRELAALDTPDAVGSLRAALLDADPAVREAAAIGLGGRRVAAAEPALIQAAKDEPWPFVRRADVDALARLCGTPGRDLLMRAMERDVDEVRRAALVGLARCHDARAGGLVLSTLKARRASATLRELAGALAGEVERPADAARLAAIVDGLVVEAEGDLAIEGVATAALRSLGHLGGPDAARTAARLASDGHHPYRHVAIEALGQICGEASAVAALARLRADPDPALAAAAVAAADRCRGRATSARGGTPAAAAMPTAATASKPTAVTP